MTLQQLKYVLAVAEKQSFSEAAKALFISQPALSSAVRELEEEIGLAIFIRGNRGIRVTGDGTEFLGYARQVLVQSDMLEAKYLKRESAPQRFRVSTQHYPFAANAFVELVREFGSDEYEFTLRETGTPEIIQDVKLLRSELGLLYLSKYNESVMRRILNENQIVFTELFTVRPHVFLCRRHPLADRERIGLEELEEYPCITFEQGENGSFYFSEEVLSTRSVKKSIRVSDRAAVVNFLIGLNGYTIATGVYPKQLHDQEIIAVPLDADERIRVGIVKHRDMHLSRLGEIYWQALEKIAARIRAGQSPDL